MQCFSFALPVNAGGGITGTCICMAFRAARRGPQPARQHVKLAAAGWLTVRDWLSTSIVLYSAIHTGTCTPPIRTLLHAGDLMFHCLASMSPFPLFPFRRQFKLSRVCRKGEDMRAFGETIGRHCRPPNTDTRSATTSSRQVLGIRVYIRRNRLALLTSAATHLSQARNMLVRLFSVVFQTKQKRA